MKALIAAGGRATRLRPITWTINKHLIPLANQPMLAHGIQKIVAAGITDIAINVNMGERENFESVFGDGSAFGAHLTYIEQKGGALGVAHVVANAKDFLKDEPFLFYLGDNIFLGSIRHLVERFQNEKLDCLLAFSRVTDPQRFGVPEFDVTGKLIQIIEKPKNPPSPFAVTGLYCYTSDFFKAFDSIQPSPRGEYEISDVNTWFIKNRNTSYEEVTGSWRDTGTPDAILEGNALLLDDTPSTTFVVEGAVDQTSRLEGLVSVGKGSVIGPNCLIRGPVAIGKDCTLADCYVGPYTSVGNQVKITSSEVEHSILSSKVTVHTERRIANSVIGVGATIIDAKQTHPHSAHRLIIGDASVVEL